MRMTLCSVDACASRSLALPPPLGLYSAFCRREEGLANRRGDARQASQGGVGVGGQDGHGPFEGGSWGADGFGEGRGRSVWTPEMVRMMGRRSLVRTLEGAFQLSLEGCGVMLQWFCFGLLVQAGLKAKTITALVLPSR